MPLIELILPIYFHTEDTAKLDDIGVTSDDLNDYKLKLVTFYNIDAIYEHRDLNKTTILCSGETFIADMKVEDVSFLIKTSII